MAGYIFRTYGCGGLPARRRKGVVVSEAVPPHEFEIMLRSDEHPSFCPKCGARVGNVEAIPGTKNVGKSDINKAVDMTYRLVEESSAERAELAGSKHLKVTNMRDHLREGDVAVPPMPSNTVTAYMADAAGKGIGYGWGGGMMAPALRSGTPSPVKVDPATGFTGPTHAALSGAQGPSGQTHLATRHQMINAGRQNKPRSK